MSLTLGSPVQGGDYPVEGHWTDQDLINAGWAWKLPSGAKNTSDNYADKFGIPRTVSVVENPVNEGAFVGSDDIEELPGNGGLSLGDLFGLLMGGGEQASTQGGGVTTQKPVESKTEKAVNPLITSLLAYAVFML